MTSDWHQNLSGASWSESFPSDEVEVLKPCKTWYFMSNSIPWLQKYLTPIDDWCTKRVQNFLNKGILSDLLDLSQGGDFGWYFWPQGHIFAKIFCLDGGDFNVIHFSTLPSSFSSFWEMTTWTKLDITRKTIGQIRFCKKIRWKLQLLNEIYRLNVWEMVFR